MENGEMKALIMLLDLSVEFNPCKAEDTKHHLYADDTQVHNSFNTSSFANAIVGSIICVTGWCIQLYPQAAMNSYTLAHIVIRSPMYTNIEDLRRKLHWPRSGLASVAK